MAKTILAIDPGTERSAWCLLADGVPEDYGTKANADMLRWLRLFDDDQRHFLVIEQVACYGQRVGREVFETVFWSGRFAQAYPWGFERITRKEVTGLICPGVQRPNDASVRAALIDRFGPGRAKAVGLKKTPGPLFGMSGDEWQALAVAVAWNEKQGA